MRKTGTSHLFLVAAFVVLLIGACALAGCVSAPQKNDVQPPEYVEENDYDVDSDTVVIDFVDEQDPINMFAASSTPIIFTAQEDGVSENGTDEPINHKNLCYSPVSLYLAMAMLGEGTSGPAQEQISTALHLADNASMFEYAEAAIEGIESGYDNYQLEIAHSLWVKDGFKPTESYKNDINDYLDAEVKTVNFGTSEADQEMSAWVSDKTKGLLKPQFQTLPQEIASLINTIYFKDSWTDPFEETDTASDTFHAQTGDVQAEFMHADELSSEFYEGANYQAASLPFSGGGHMMFILPNEGVLPYDLVDTDTKVAELINPDTDTVDYVDINWTLPKFEITSSFENLRENLEDMGIVDVFLSGNPSTFENMIEPANDFYVSDVIQETFMSLDEDGVEAAAYTAAVMKTSALPDKVPVVDFVLDRPFVYLIKAPNGMVIFMGIVENPS